MGLEGFLTEGKSEQRKKGGEDKFWLGVEHCRGVKEGSPLGAAIKWESKRTWEKES